MLNVIMFIMLTIMFLSIIIMIVCWRVIMKKIVQKITAIILSDNYEENIMELLPGMRHVGIQRTLENSLRAESGELLYRPLGSSKTWPHFDPLTFIPAQTTPFQLDKDTEVDISVTIGPKAKKPLQLKIPLMISGMAYGIALSKPARLSLATAAKNVGTAINSGEGGVLQDELDAADKYILQFSKTKWSKEEHLIQRADMIEVKLGQGALMGIGERILPKNLTGDARQVMGLKDDEDAIIFEHFFENQTLDDLKELVDELRTMSGGVPIGVKMGAGGKIEEDIEHLLQLSVDYIAIDGGQASTMGGAPILADDFGIPTLHAIIRAVKYLEKKEMNDEVSLIVSGGITEPGHMLKALALGADAVYLGSAILFAVAHGQGMKALPFEPPTQVVWNNGKLHDQFDQNIGAQGVENFINASTEELKVALRAMGKKSLSELTKKDLISYDKLTADYVGVPFSFDSMMEESLDKKDPNGKAKRMIRKRRE